MLNVKCVYLLIFFILIYADCFSQIRATIPWSNTINQTFGSGTKNPGPPLPASSTDFTYTTDSCPSPGFYTIVNHEKCFRPDTMTDDAGHVYFGPHPLSGTSGYMMLVNYQSSSNSKIVFRDTARNLCSNSKYLFWAAVRNLGFSTCTYANLSFDIETLSGQVLQSFQTGNIGGSGDNGKPYYGFQGIDIKAPFPFFYGGSFTTPPGINAVVVKIKTNPGPDLPCTNNFVIDNIELSAIGPDLNISLDDNPDSWIAGTCFSGNKPVNLSGAISNGYIDFATSQFTVGSYIDPAVQWQKSADGYTWSDISGETNMHLSKIFSMPDTFYVRLRASENDNISNASCSNVSNVIQVQVDGLPKDFNITSNSPVCTDSDIVLNVAGGASYFVSGPNGYYDNSPFPHVYHPGLSDSGWYYAQIISFGGCIANDSTFVHVYGPDLKISVADSLLCYGKTTQLNSSGGNIYLWSPKEGLSNSNIANPIAKPLTTTKYNLQITDATGCSAYGSIIIQVRDSLLKAAMIAPTVVCPNDLVLFKDTSVGKITSWLWDFGNGQTSTSQNPLEQHYPFSENNLNYPIRLSVTDSAGCADTTITFVKAVNNCYIAVPSAFTPNHDGLNDYLYPLNAYKATNLIFKVYDRFGRVIFETKDWSKKWDGTISGIAQPTGTYVWILNYTDENNRKISLKGTTVLLR